MIDHDSVSNWLEQLKNGPRDGAIDRLWERYFERMVRLAGNHLRSRPRAAADEEDVALSAFDSFVRAVEQKRFPRLNDRNELWQVLFTLTKRKVFDHVEQEMAAKRGGGLHHVAIHVADLTQAVENLKKTGTRFVSEEIKIGAGGHLYVFVHPSSTGGVLLELVQDVPEGV